MEKEPRELCLFGIMVVLIVAVVLVAWLEVPSFLPPIVTYQSGVDDTEKTNASNEETRRISLNGATAAELMQLEGMGETLASRVLTYREENGGFSSVDELLLVEGIGVKRLEQWRPYLVL